MNLFIAGADVACSLITFILLITILLSGAKDKTKNKYLIVGMASIAIFSMSDGVSFCMDEFGGPDILLTILNILSYIGADIIVTAVVYYMSERIRECCDFPKIYSRVVLCAAILDILIVFAGLYTGFLFTVKNGHTVYGMLNDYLGVTEFIVLAFFLICVSIRRKNIEKKIFVSTVIYFVAPFISLIITFFNNQLTLSYLSASVSFIIIYVIIVQEDLHESALNERIMYKASITDVLTGQLNRKAYADAVANFSYPYPKDFVYMSLDLNGLKQANDSKGHAAGDELLIGATQCMNRAFSAYGNVYRTGGDEFNAILNIPTDKLEDVLNNFESELANWHGDTVDTMSISYGYVRADEIVNTPIDKVAAIADERMYVAKANYYKTKGIDRRGLVISNDEH